MTKKEFYAALRKAGHRLRGDDDGQVDIFVLDDGYHNGPGCVRCGNSWCHHCREGVTPCRGKRSGVE